MQEPAREPAREPPASRPPCSHTAGAALDSHLLSSPAWQHHDPELRDHASDWSLSVESAAGTTVLRLTPSVHGLPVVGADRIFALDDASGDWLHAAVHGGSISGDHLLQSSDTRDASDSGPLLAKRSSWFGQSGPAGQPAADPDSDGPASASASAPGFTLNVREAIDASRRQAAHFGIPPHNRVQDTEQSPLALAPVQALPMYLSTQNAPLRPIWRIVDPAHMPSDRQIRYIDGRSGALVATIPTVFHADKANLFPERGAPSLGQKPPLVDLLDVFVPSPPTNNNHGIQGRDFVSSNTCFAYQCANNATNGDCDETQSVCVNLKEAQDKGLVENKDYFTATSYFATSGKYIDLDRDWQADGYNNSIIYMAWLNAPVFAPRVRVPAPDASGDRLWTADTDFTQYTGRENNDTLSEVQAYHYLSTHASFMRNLLNDPNFCFVGSGPNCTTMDPRTNRTATRFDHPMRYITNFQSIKTWPTVDSEFPDLLMQLDRGLGKNLTHPVLFDQHDDYGDAFFSNSNFQPPINGSNAAFRNCTFGGCVSVQDSPFSFFAFGQNADYDWTLNNCIAYHELTHSLVQKFIPDLSWVVWTSSGLLSDPGALNEAWADYFAALHCGISNFRKTYNGRPGRNLDNSMTCAESVGQVHTDSMIFSGALWEVRNAVPLTPPLTADDQIKFDRVVLRALMLGHASDTFASQMRLILSLLEQDAVLAVLKPIAQAVFDRRELKCSRIKAYRENMDTTYFLPTALTTAANLSTLPSQLMLSPRRSDWGLTIKWTQWYISPILGPLSIGYGRTKLKVAVSLGCPIFLNGSTGSDIYPYSSCGSGESAVNRTLEWIETSFSDKTKEGSIHIDLGLSPPDSVYIWFAHQVPATMVMFSSLMTYHGFVEVWRYGVASVGCLAALVLVIGTAAVLSMAVADCFSGRRRQRRLSGSSATAPTSPKTRSGPAIAPAQSPGSATAESVAAVAASSSRSPNNDAGKLDSHDALTVDTAPAAHAQTPTLSAADRQQRLRHMRIAAAQLAASGLLFTGAGVLAILAIIFNKVRAPFTWSMFIPFAAGCLVDASVGLLVWGETGLAAAALGRVSFGRRGSAPGPTQRTSPGSAKSGSAVARWSEAQVWLVVSASTLVVVCATVGGWLVHWPGAPLGVHAVFFVVFCVAAGVRLCASVVVVAGLLRWRPRDRQPPGTEMEMTEPTAVLRPL